MFSLCIFSWLHLTLELERFCQQTAKYSTPDPYGQPGELFLPLNPHICTRGKGTYIPWMWWRLSQRWLTIQKRAWYWVINLVPPIIKCAIVSFNLVFPEGNIFLFLDKIFSLPGSDNSVFWSFEEVWTDLFKVSTLPGFLCVWVDSWSFPSLRPLAFRKDVYFCSLSASSPMASCFFCPLPSGRATLAFPGDSFWWVLWWPLCSAALMLAVLDWTHDLN